MLFLFFVFMKSLDVFITTPAICTIFYDLEFMFTIGKFSHLSAIMFFAQNLHYTVSRLILNVNNTIRQITWSLIKMYCLRDGFPDLNRLSFSKIIKKIFMTLQLYLVYYLLVNEVCATFYWKRQHHLHQQMSRFVWQIIFAFWQVYCAWTISYYWNMYFFC